MPAIGTMIFGRVERNILIEKAFAAQIVVHADDIGNRRIVPKPLQVCGTGAGEQQKRPHRVVLVYSSGKHVPRQPATFIFKISLIGESWTGERFSQVVGLNQASSRID